MVIEQVSLYRSTLKLSLIDSLLGFYQSPITYTASATTITTLGETEEFQLGQTLKSIYANSTSPNFVTGLNPTLLQPTQYTSVADGGGEGGQSAFSSREIDEIFY